MDPDEAYRRIFQSNSGALYFAQCAHPQETWLPLLEKCYAKAHGDYCSIEGGHEGEGLEDLTGGITSELVTTDILDRVSYMQPMIVRTRTNKHTYRSTSGRNNFSRSTTNSFSGVALASSVVGVSVRVL